jgi:hypothetical protein
MTAFGSACHRAPRFEYDFEQSETLDQFEWKCRTQYRLSPDHSTSGARSLEISFHPAADGNSENYPGISFAKFDPDWSRYSRLVFDAYNPESTIIRLALRIDDRESPNFADRYNRSLLLSPGINHVSIPMAELVTSGTRRALDPQRIHRVVVFLANPGERHVLYLDRFGLE